MARSKSGPTAAGVSGSTAQHRLLGQHDGRDAVCPARLRLRRHARPAILRFGQADGPFGIFDNGVTTFQGFDDGGWNGDLPGAAIPGNAGPQFPFLSQQGAEYGSSKLVYLSPQLAGFDFGLS